MSYKKRKQAEFNKCRTAANGQTCRLLQDKLQLRFDLQPAGLKALRAVQEQWSPLPRSEYSDHWDWEEIVRAYNGLGDQSLALWSGEKLDQLAALAVARISGPALCWDYLEGHPSGLLRPQRFAIILDAYVRYGRSQTGAEMTALLATIGRAAAWLTRGSAPRAGECREVDGLWEMLSPAEREAAFNFEGDDTIGQR